MRKLFSLLLVLVLIGSTYPVASAAMPTTEDLFGKFMPSLQFAIDLDIEIIDQDEYVVQKCTNVEFEDFEQVGKYMARSGCSLKQSQLKNGMYSAVVAKGQAAIDVEYHYINKTITVYYPKGSTRPEKEATEVNNNKISSLFPVEEYNFMVMPSVISLFKIAPDYEENIDEYKYQFFYDLKASAYSRFCKHVESYGCKLYDEPDENGWQYKIAEFDENEFYILFSKQSSTLLVVYPQYAQIEGENNCNIVGHQWTEATCETPKTCLICGLTEGKMIAHECNDWTIDREPSVTMNGQKHGTCMYCGTEMQETIPCEIACMKDQCVE